MKKFSIASLRVLVVIGVLTAPILGLRYQLVTIHEMLADMFLVQRQQNHTAYITMDTMIRTLHYTIPHDPYVFVNQPNGSSPPMCPECVDVLKEANLYQEPGVWIDEARLNELLRKEKELADWMAPQPMCD